jgi:hypothetical protein
MCAGIALVLRLRARGHVDVVVSMRDASDPDHIVDESP